MKRTIVTFMIISMVLGNLVGCSAKKGVEGEQVTTTTEEKLEDKKELKEKEQEEVYTLNIYGNSNVLAYPEGEAIKVLEEHLGVDINLIPQITEEQANVKMATGETPDYLPDTMSVASVTKWIEQGMIATIDEKMVAEVMPRYMEWAKKWFGDDIFKYGRFGTENDYYLPVIWSLGPNLNIMGYREDWRKALGLPVPTTLDEYEDLLRAFVEEDPDKNGKNDTYGVTTYVPNSVIGPYGPTAVWGAYGVYPGTFYDKDGKIVFGSIEPEAKDALARLNKWYEEGILDPEFLINKRDNAVEKWVANQVGSVESSWYSFVPKQAFYSGKFYETLKENQPDAEVGTLSELKGKSGQYGNVQVNPNKGGVVFGKHMESQPEKMKKYFEYFEYISFHEEGIENRQYGIRGKTFEFTEEEGIEWIPPYDDIKKREEFGINFAGTHFNDYQLRAKYETPLEYRDIRAEVEFKANGKFDVIERAYRPIFNDKGQMLKTFEQEAIIEFITGARSLDSFDDFVEEWLQMGGEEVLQEAQEVYKTFK